MSTFKELVQDLHRESGASGSTPSTVENQTGEALRMVRWIRRADLHIQKLWHDWKFLWSPTQYSEDTVDGTRDATVPTTQGIWALPTAGAWRTAATLPGSTGPKPGPTTWGSIRFT